jgi:hypothetical protein
MTVASRFAPRVAVLIDAENVSYKHAEAILDQIRKFGGTVEVGAYGSKAVCKGWMEQLKGIQPRRMSPQKTGKGNVVDMAMMLDAMVFLLRQKVSHMYLVTSDSDFIPLVRKLKLHKCRAVVFAEDKASDRLKSECDEFVLLKRHEG